MLGVFYAKHNDCFLKAKQTFAICRKQNFIKLQNVCDNYIYVCCEMNVFFLDFFMNRFPKIHRSVLNKIPIAYYVFEMLMMSIYEKKILAEARLIHTGQMSLYTFIILRKKQWTQMKTK